jgi:hypothetical protein
LLNASQLTGTIRPVGRSTPRSRRSSVWCSAGPKGRTAPHVEHVLWTRIGRVWEALRDGRDPGVAFETPLDDEEPFTADVENEEPLTTDVQIANAKSLARLLDEVDRELRTAHEAARRSFSGGRSNNITAASTTVERCFHPSTLAVRNSVSVRPVPCHAPRLPMPLSPLSAFHTTITNLNNASARHARGTRGR